jgi:flagellar biosynthesis protein FlhF
MKLKTYHAPTLHAALRLARIELGSEAVLLEAKEREAETAEARFQVTFALGAEGEIPRAAPAKLDMPHWKSFLSEAAAPAAAAVPEPKPEEPPKPQPRAARAKAAGPKRKRPPKAPRAHEAAPEAFAEAAGLLRTAEIAALFGRLAAAGVTTAEAADLVSRAARSAGRDDDADALEAAVRETLDAGWKVHAAPEPAARTTRLLAFVGPAGAGKSATAVKAASLLLRAYDRPAALLSLGRHPVGGVEAVEAWATLLDMRLEIVEAPENLPAALDRLTAGPRPPGAVIFDTPADQSAAAALNQVQELETHLVLPSTYSPADLLRTWERYGGARLDAAVPTRLDECAAPGALWSFQRRCGLPASYLGCGPETPGDLRPATARRLTQRLLGR